MAFNINAQVILSQPKNLNNVSNQISKQLGQAANIKIKIGNAQQLTNLTKQLTTLNNSFTKLNSNIVSIGKAQNNFNSQLNKTNSSLKTQGGLLSNLAGRFGSVAKQAIAFGLISRPIYDLQRALTQSVKAAVEFEREIVRISQVTGKTVSQLNGLTTEIGRLSTGLGVSANELADTARVIAQAGIRGKELERVLTALARSTLAPTFGKIADTTEGLIAAFGQFGLKGQDAEAILGSLNKVSKEFAVEAEDLISVIRRTGGVFAQAAGDSKGTIQALQELTAVFTAVRSSTRESADTIAAGLRTIFSRIQRRGTIDFLRQFNIDLVDAKGNFIGVFPAFDQLSKKLDTLIKQGDALTLSAIAEELGGIRQIGKLLPAIAQFDKARKALEEAQKGAAEGLSGDVAKALDTTERRVAQVRESFKQLIRTVFESDAFQNFTKNILASANSFLTFANSITQTIEPLLPLLTALGAFKLGRGVGGLISGGVGGAVASATGSTATAQATQKTAAATVTQNNLITNTNSILTQISKQLSNIFQVNNAGFNQANKTLITISAKTSSSAAIGFAGRRKASGGKILGFNRGGIVPGTGNSDTVPAMLQPGEFVIKKSSVNSLGAGTLQAMNENRFQKAGPVRKTNLQKLQGGEEISLAPGKIGVFKQALLRRSGDKDGDAELDIGGAFLKPSGVINNLRGTIVGNEILAEVIKDIGGTQAQARSLLTKSTGASKNLKIPINVQSGSFTTRKAARFRSGFRKAAAKFGADFNNREIGLPYSMSKFKSSYNVSNKEQIEGGIFESFLNAISNKPFDNAKINPNDTFDFKQGLGTAAKVFGLPGDLTADAKRTFDTDSLASLVKKGGNLLIQNITRDLATQLLTVGAKGNEPQIAARRAALSQKAAGGSISRQDTVPALLTPGEFVFNKKSASRIGYGTLNTMNKKGITGFNKGGTVGGIQKFGNGTSGIGVSESALAQRTYNPGDSSLRRSMGPLIKEFDQLEKSTEKTTKATKEVTKEKNKEVTASKKAGTGKYKGKDPARRERARQRLEARRGAGGGRGAGNAIGLVFAAQALTSTMTDADSATGKFIQNLTNAALTLSLFSSVIPQGAIGKAKGALGITGKFAGFGGAGLGSAGAGAAAAGIGGVAAAGLAGGVAGKLIGDQVANVVLGEQKQIGQIRGDGDISKARSRAAFGAGGAILGGAAAGAALGSFVPVIGTALGAVIGGASGAIVAYLTSPLDVAAQEAAFNIAQRLQDGGKVLKDSLDKLNKDFNSISFGKFARDFNDQTKDLTTSIPKLAENLDKASRFRGRRKAELDVARSFKDIIRPEDVDKSRAAISQGLEKLFANIGDQDLSNILSTGNTEQFNQALAQAAQNGNLFAKEVLVSRNNLATQNALLKAGELADKKRSEEEKKTAIVLQNVARNFDFVTGSAAELDQAILKVAGENNLSAAETRFARTEIKKFAEDQKKGAEEEARALAQQQQLNRALEESAQSVNAFNLAVRESVAGLTESLARSGEKFDLFAQRVADIESGSGAVRLDTSLANRGSDEVVSIIEKTSGQNLSAFRNLENVQKNLPNIIKSAVESIPATAGTQQTTDALIRAIQQQSGLQVSGDFQKGLETRIRALISSRQTQGGDDTILAGKALAEALDKGEIDKLLGEVVQEQQTAFEELKKNAEVLRKQFENRINFEISRLKQAKAFEQKIFSKRLSNENIINNILNRNVNQLDQAFSNLNRQLQTTAGSSNINALLGQRESALAGKRQLEQQIELGDTSAETANQLIEFSRQLTESDAALKQFAEDTSIAAAIQAEASKLQQQRGAAESAIESIVSAGLGGDQGALKGISSQVQAFDRFQAGQASFQDVISVFKNIEGPILSALAGDQAGEIKKFATGILAAQFKGTPAEGIIKRLQGQSVNVQERIFGLAQEANRINNLQLQTLYAIQQQNEAAITQAGAGTDPFSASVNVFSQAVGAFADVVARGGGGVFAGGGPVNRAAGGIIYKNQGGVSDGTLVGAFASRFSKGTDTIPAMLSPGEYVISAPAVSKVGVGTLDAINSGNVATKSKGGILYKDDGGLIARAVSEGNSQLKNNDIDKGSLISDYAPILKKFEKKTKTNDPYPPMTKNGMYEYITNIIRNKDSELIPAAFASITANGTITPNGIWQNETFTDTYYDVMAKYMDESLRDNIKSERALSNSTKDRIARTGVSILNMAKRGSTNSDTREFSGSLRGQVFLDPKNKTDRNGRTVEFPLSGTGGSELATLFNFTQVLGANDRKKLYQTVFDMQATSLGDIANPLTESEKAFAAKFSTMLPILNNNIQTGIKNASMMRSQKIKSYFNIKDIMKLPYLGLMRGMPGRWYKNPADLINRLTGYHSMIDGNNQFLFQNGNYSQLQEMVNRGDIYEQISLYLRGKSAFQNFIDGFIKTSTFLTGFRDKGKIDPSQIMYGANHNIYEQFKRNYKQDLNQTSGKLDFERTQFLRESTDDAKLDEALAGKNLVLDREEPIVPNTFGLPYTVGEYDDERKRRKAEGIEVRGAFGDAGGDDDDKVERNAADQYLKKKRDFFAAIFGFKGKSPIANINKRIVAANANIERLSKIDPQTDQIKRNIQKQTNISQKLIQLRAGRIFSLTKSAGLLWKNDPLLRNPEDKGGMTDEERQAVQEYNRLYSEAFFTNDRAKYDAAETFLNGFIGKGTPNSRKILDRINFVKSYLGITRGELPVFHQGGFVQGYSKGGDVPIMAQQGEFIMNRRAVDRVGLGNMMSINNGGFGGGSTSLAKPMIELSNRIQGLSILSRNIANLTASLNNPTLVAGMYQAFTDGATKLSLALQPLNNIPESIEMKLAPVDIAGLDGFTQQVVDGVINKLIDMRVIGQPVQNTPTVRPGTDLY